MRLFELLAFQHIMLYLIPTLIFIVLFGIFLSFTHIRRGDSQERQERIVERFADDITGRDAPFPLGMALTIAGAVIWGLLYIWFTGAWGIRI